VEVTLYSLQYLLLKFLKYLTVQDLPRAQRPRLWTADMMNTIDYSLKADDELIARKLKEKLAGIFSLNFPNVSISTIKRCRKGVCTRPHQFQLVREANKEKRKDWCQSQINNWEKFEDVISQMSVLFSWIIMVVFVFEKRGRVTHLSNGQNTQSKYTSGVEYQCDVQLVW